MFEIYIKGVGMITALLSVAFAVTLLLQYRRSHLKDLDGVYLYFRVQSMMVMVIYGLSFVVLLNHYEFSREILLLFVGELALLFFTNVLIEQYMMKSLLPLWSISQFLVIIGFILMTRLNLALGVKQFYFTAAGYGLALVVAAIYHRLNFIRYLGPPAIVTAIFLLLVPNIEMGGATNWLQIGNITFQPSEPVKILFILFLASIFDLFPQNRFRTIVVTGFFTAAMTFIQVFQKDLGSALIYYVVFILMCYVYTTNRMYIIGGGAVTLVAGYFAWIQFSHVRVRVEAWLNPWADIDNKGYQIAQSLFAIGNGGLIGSGLTLGEPSSIPVVTTDFIYSAIVEELGILVGVAILVVIVMYLVFGIQMLTITRSDFDFLLGSGLLIVYAFQSFLIIGGVTRAVPLTGVTLPFVSYGGSSLLTTFILLGVLQGIKLSIKKHKRAYKRSKEAVDEG